MSLDDLADKEGEISRFREEENKELSEMSARELAYHIKAGDESQRMIYRSFLEAQPDEYRDKVEDALADSLLGETEKDDFLMDDKND
jgi:hypothetical protein